MNNSKGNQASLSRLIFFHHFSNKELSFTAVALASWMGNGQSEFLTCQQLYEKLLLMSPEPLESLDSLHKLSLLPYPKHPSEKSSDFGLDNNTFKLVLWISGELGWHWSHDASIIDKYSNSMFRSPEKKGGKAKQSEASS